MKKSIIVLLAALMAIVCVFSACSGGDTANDTEDTTAAAVESSVTEDDAKAVALENAGVPETAAENLTVTEGDFEGEKAFIVTFNWSGFDYEYTVNAASGKIVKYIFDGDEMEIKE